MQRTSLLARATGARNSLPNFFKPLAEMRNVGERAENRRHELPSFAAASLLSLFFLASVGHLLLPELPPAAICWISQSPAMKCDSSTVELHRNPLGKFVIESSLCSIEFDSSSSPNAPALGLTKKGCPSAIVSWIKEQHFPTSFTKTGTSLSCTNGCNNKYVMVSSWDSSFHEAPSKLKIYTTLGYIVSQIFLNLEHVFSFRIVSYFETILRPFWDHFETILRPFWDH